MSDTPQTINGELLRLKRESRGWLISDLATRACMSTKQIRQLEEGGSSAFYSESVKRTSAKKVGGILGLSPDEVFGVPATETVNDRAGVDMASADSEEITLPVSNGADSEPPVTKSVPESEGVPEALASGPATEQKNKTPLGAIAALFVAALAVAAWMRPETELATVEPPPPLQTLPAEPTDGAASATSAFEVMAPAMAASSAASAMVPPAPAVTQASSPARPALLPSSAPASKTQ